MRRLFFLFIVCNFLSQFSFSQGAIDGYMKSKKETDIALTYSYESYDQYYFGNEIQDADVTSQSLSLFLAHGLSNQVNLIASVPYIRTDANNRNFQDAIVALKFRNKKRTIGTGALSTITSFGFSFPISGYDADTDNPIGQRAVAFQLRHLYQYEVSGFFAQIQSGFDFRLIPTTQFAIPIIFRTGFAASKFYVDGWLDVFHTMDSGVDQSISGGEGSRYLKIGGTFYYSIFPQFGVFVGGAQYLSGRNIGKASRINIGVVWKRF